MTILAYARKDSDAGERLLQVIERCTLLPSTEWCATIAGLITRLCRPRPEPVIAMLAAADQRDMTSILSCRHLLQEMRIILILPDHDTKTVAAAHKLHPRYLAYRDDDPAGVVAVLEKMLSGSEMALTENC